MRIPVAGDLHRSFIAADPAGMNWEDHHTTPSRHLLTPTHTCRSMTDWLPFAFVLSAGVFTVLWLLLGAVRDAGGSVDRASTAYWGALVLTGLVFAVYLVAGEGWLWY